MADKEIKKILESLLFVCDEPLTAGQAAKVLEKTEGETRVALDELAKDFVEADRGIQLRKVAHGYRLYTHPANAPFVEKLVVSWDSRRLTRAALETLAIIAYKQPITKISISSIRGVNSDGVVASLTSKGLVKEMGREKSPGAPILYGSSDLFLEKFGLCSLEDLPALEEFEPDSNSRVEIEAGLGRSNPIAKN
ncbi:MAG: SMC-Scp complex subunit ScpB [Actinomycetia bacterium]|nr:SMC-Scp complex subunit ScpB [Actinomycetes bacterium]